MITKDKLNELCDAQAKLCSFCEVDECERRVGMPVHSKRRNAILF